MAIYTGKQNWVRQKISCCNPFYSQYISFLISDARWWKIQQKKACKKKKNLFINEIKKLISINNETFSYLFDYPICLLLFVRIWILVLNIIQILAILILSQSDICFSFYGKSEAKKWREKLLIKIEYLSNIIWLI